MNSIKAVVNEPIDGHEEYHMMVIIIGMNFSYDGFYLWINAGKSHTIWKKTKGIGLNKSRYWVNNFLISQQKHMLWVLISSASLRCF